MIDRERYDCVAEGSGGILGVGPDGWLLRTDAGTEIEPEMIGGQLVITGNDGRELQGTIERLYKGVDERWYILLAPPEGVDPLDPFSEGGR